MRLYHISIFKNMQVGMNPMLGVAVTVKVSASVHNCRLGQTFLEGEGAKQRLISRKCLLMITASLCTNDPQP